MESENPMLRIFVSRAVWTFGIAAGLLAYACPAIAQDDKIQDALKIQPKQAGIDFDTPEKDELANCRLENAKESGDSAGWVVVDGAGRILRKFLDNNNDKKLDQWSYFKDGIEVYRDIDANFDGKTDQYRWMGAGGLRWGLDPNQDGEIDSWKQISAEEVAEEVFLALQTSDVKRFERLLVTEEELASLKLGKPLQESVAERLKKADDFKNLVRSQKSVTARSEFSGFGTIAPSLVPAGNQGAGSDVIFYDNASAMFQTGEQFGQIAVGTLVQVDRNLWRAIESPQLAAEGTAVVNGGVFFPLPAMGAPVEQVAGGEDVEMFSKLFGDLDEVEKALNEAKRPAEINRLEKKRADVIRAIVKASQTEEDRQNWIRSLTDLVADAYRQDRFPEGLEYLQEYFGELKKDGTAENLVDYIPWRIINTRWSKGLELDREAREEANDVYYRELEQFVEDFPKSEFAAQALGNLANNSEILQETEDAVKWYRTLASNFGDSIEGQRAKGALVRLNAGDAVVEFIGETVDQRRFDLGRARGKIVVIHYWDTECDLCIESFDELKRLKAKYRDELFLIGANLDRELSTVKKFLAENKSIDWPQLWAEGGGDSSPLAIQLGVSVMPTLVLVDAQGKLIDSNLPVSDLDREIQRLQKRAAKRD